MPRSLNYNTEIIIIADNVRSSHNIGSLFRTAEGLGVKELILSGYSSYPLQANDSRLRHIAERADRQITKTALGAEKSLKWQHTDNILSKIRTFKNEGYTIYALEQSSKSQSITDVKPAEKSVIIVGNEVDGLGKEVLKVVDQVIEIPMLGKKESFNVVQAAAMAIFHFKFN